MNDTKYWEIRSRGYKDLEWVKNKKFLSEMISACKCSKSDIVLEIGVGTGVVSNSGLDKKTQDKIMFLHRNASGEFKQDYNLRQTKDDCLIDMHMCIVTGTK